MSYPFYFSLPGCFLGTTLYSSPHFCQFMYNNNLPTGLNPYIHSKLFYCSRISLLNHWIYTLVHYLRDYGLKYLVPDTHEYTIMELILLETKGLFFPPVFFIYVPQQGYPEWVKECPGKQMYLYDIVRRAMALVMQRSSINTLINTTSSL